MWLSYFGGEIRIGGVTISPVDILFAILVFLAGISAAAALRRWLANKVLPNTRFDYGVRNSIAAGTGYVAFGIAVMLASRRPASISRVSPSSPVHCPLASASDCARSSRTSSPACCC